MRAGPTLGAACAAIVAASCGARTDLAILPDGGDADGARDAAPRLDTGSPPPTCRTAPWFQRYGDADQQYAVTLDVGGECDVLVGGYFAGVLDLGPSRHRANGATDGWIARLDASGGPTMSRSFGSISPDAVEVARIAPDGGIVLGARSEGIIDFGGGARGAVGMTDAFVASLARDGTHRWTRQIGGPGLDAVKSLLPTPDGGAWVGGYFTGPVDFGAGPVDGAPLEGFLARYDARGELVWSQRFGSSAGVEGMASTRFGDVVVVGTFQGRGGFGGLELVSAGGNDGFWIVLGDDGAARAGGSFGDDGPLWLTSVGVDARSGDIVLGGAFSGTVDFGGGALASDEQSLFVVRLDSDGAHRASRAFSGASGVVQLESLAVGPDGVTALTGFFTEAIDFGGGTHVTAGSQDIFVAWLDPALAYAGSRRIGGSGSDFAFEVAVDPIGQPVLAGYFTGELQHGTGSLVSAGSWDVFIGALRR